MSLANDYAESTRFLELIGKDPELTWIRCLRQWKRQAGTGNDTQHLELKPDANAYFITGNGDPANGRTVKDSDIKSCSVLFVEWDDKPDDWQLTAWKVLGLPEPTVSVSTGGKSIHHYWFLNEAIEPEQWRMLMKLLIAYCNSDKSCCNPSRSMRLPGSIYYDKETGEQIGQCKIIGGCERRYSAVDIEACLPPVLAKAAPKAAVSNRIAATSSQWEPRSIDEIKAAAAYIPDRIGGKGTYEQDRNALCGCAAALAEAGYPEAIAIELLANKWPTVKAAEQVLKTATTRNAGSYWRIAKEHGYQLNRPRGWGNG